MGRSLGVLGITALVVSTSASADTSTERARERILRDAYEKAYRDAEKLPPVSEREFIKWWRRSFDELTTDTCRCQYSDKKCARLAMDTFAIDLAGIMFRVRGVREGLIKAENPATFGQEFTAALLKKHVPAKEQLRKQARLEQCVDYALGKRFSRP